MADIQTLAFSFRGRIGRAMYWLGALLFFVNSLILLIASFTIPTGFLATSIGLIGVIVGFWLVLSVAIKRLHDRNKSGWYVLLYFFILGVLEAIAEDAGPTQPLDIIVFIAGAALVLWAAIELGFLRGTVGSNRYGPDPLDPTAATAGTT